MLRFHSVEAEIQLLQVFKKKQNIELYTHKCTIISNAYLAYEFLCNFIQYTKGINFPQSSGKIVTEAPPSKLCSQKLYQ